MPRPDQTPGLPKLPFLLADAALLATAAFTAATSAHPLATTPLVAVVSCVALAAALGVIPFLTDYARRQDEALDERQRALEALGATVTGSAEQIGIAATGVHEIAELVQKNLRAADQLPHKLQEKISEFTAQLANARADETEELEKSLAELRAAESERLATIAEKISKATVDLAKLEAAFQKQLSSTTEALAQLAASSRQQFSELASATSAAIDRTQTAATAAIDGKLNAADLALQATRSALLAELDTQLSNFRTGLAEQLRPFPSFPVNAPPPASPLSAFSPEPSRSGPPTGTLPSSENDASSSTPRKRSLKKPASSADGADSLPLAEPTLNLIDVSPADAAAEPARSPPSAIAAEDDFVQFSPDEIAPPRTAPTTTPENVPSAPATPASDSDSDSDSATAPSARSDGATRLSVTAYIGIGNRLFIRGTGPGLSWEKGVPLHFVSIGKWRWETNDAITPIVYKLYKNDALECTSLGEQSLPPAQETEVTATF